MASKRTLNKALPTGQLSTRAARFTTGLHRQSADGFVPVADQDVIGAALAVLSAQVLEHVADLDAYCAEIRRLLREDGTLLLSTHGNWLYHPHPEDHRRWTRTGLALDLAFLGLCSRVA